MNTEMNNNLSQFLKDRIDKLSQLKEIFLSGKLPPEDQILKLRCSHCRKLLTEVGIDTLGLIDCKCYDSHCNAKSTFLIWDQHIFLVEKQLTKKKHLLAEIQHLHPKLYRNILELLN